MAKWKAKTPNRRPSSNSSRRHQSLTGSRSSRCSPARVNHDRTSAEDHPVDRPEDLEVAPEDRLAELPVAPGATTTIICVSRDAAWAAVTAAPSPVSTIRIPRVYSAARVRDHVAVAAHRADPRGASSDETSTRVHRHHAATAENTFKARDRHAHNSHVHVARGNQMALAVVRSSSQRRTALKSCKIQPQRALHRKGSERI